jgi:hypothetical protein
MVRLVAQPFMEWFLQAAVQAAYLLLALAAVLVEQLPLAMEILQQLHTRELPLFLQIELVMLALEALALLAPQEFLVAVERELQQPQETKLLLMEAQD